MRIQGVLDKSGKVELYSAPLLRSDHVAVWVEIPDGALDTLSGEEKKPERGKPVGKLSSRARAMLKQLDDIRSQPVEEDALLKWSEENQARWEAFAFRNVLRQSEGRPA